MENSKNDINKIKEKIKIGIIIFIIIAIILTVILIVISKKNNENIINNIANLTKAEMNAKTPILTTKKLYNYIDMLQSGYYMKYKTQADLGNGEKQDLTAEMAITKDKMAINNQEYLTSYITTLEGIYYISHSEKIVLKYANSTGTVENTFVDLLSGYSREVFDDNFVSTGTEKIEDEEYYYEEYKEVSDTSKIRYYFDENDIIRYIKTIASNEESLIQILELSGDVDETLFEIPKDYEVKDFNEYYNTISQINGQ